MAEPRKVNSNVEKYKALGKRFGGAEGRKQDQFDAQTKEAPSEITNVITGPVTDKIEKIDAKPVADSIFRVKPTEEKKP